MWVLEAWHKLVLVAMNFISYSYIHEESGIRCASKFYLKHDPVESHF